MYPSEKYICIFDKLCMSANLCALRVLIIIIIIIIISFDIQGLKRNVHAVIHV